MTKNKKIGLTLVLSPWIIGVILLIGFGVYWLERNRLELRFPSTTTTPYGTTIIDYYSPELDRLGVALVVLWWAGIVDVLYLFVGTGVGTYFLVKKNNEDKNSQVSNKI